MTFLENSWYAAAWDDEIGESPLARRILDRPVVLFRGDDGNAIALADRCIHRHAPLSHGRVEGAGIRCGYHGLLFASDGTCIEVPGQTKVPPGASVKSYPVVERDRFVWIWMGDPARADAASVPDYHWNDDPEWKSVQGRFHVAGDYRLIVDNLLDLSHVQFVHGATLGTDRIAQFPVEVSRDGDRVHVDRWIMGGKPPGMFARAGGIDFDVDRWQLITWTPPSHVVIDAGCAPAGQGAREGNRADGIELYSNHTITPETETSAHYFWHHARGFNLEDDSITAYLAEAAETTFGEDVGLIEAQQRSIETMPDGLPQVDINADAGVLAARRILDRLIAEQA